MEIPLIKITGPSRVIGEQLGERFCKKIKELIEDRWARIIELEKDRDKIVRILEKCINMTRKYSPVLVEEMEGIASGSNIGIEDICLLNGYTDIEDVFKPDAQTYGCTAFYARNEMMNMTYLGQTWDLYSNDKKHICLLEINKNDTKALVLSIMGCVGLMGFNNHGIGILINKIWPNDSKAGVIFPVVIREVLRQTTFESAVGRLKEADFISGHNYLIADFTGQCVSIETTGTEKEVILPDRSFYVHANHYKGSLKRLERKLDPKCTTYERHDRLEFLLSNCPIELDSLKKYLSDHEGMPKNICVHNWPEGVDTNAAIIMDLKNRSAWIAGGNPCQNEFRLFSLKESS